ncbi:MAG: hypothetical protein KDK99_02100 [Verrucomicrobiales bacterium]|nr:hypothetical protein [Verrucomicrobiales bacterium]
MTSAFAVQQCVVLGDSLTKEYEVEFPILFPDNPASWDSRNWAEILHTHRNAWFDQGDFDPQPPPQFSGHTHNWGFPGATTQEIRDRLASTSLLDYAWQQDLKNQIANQAERVVVFAGGNDLDDYYDTIYDGGNATALLNQTRDNLKWIVDWVRTVDATVPIVLVPVPHLGFVPDVRAQNPTDPVKTGRVTTALNALNAELASFAQSRGIGFASGVYDLTVFYITQPLRIGGVSFILEGDADARPRYAFSGDDFHPNTCAQARVAQEILKAFTDKYPSPVIPPLTDAEILQNVLGIPPDTALWEWLAAAGVPAGQQTALADWDGDGINHLIEYSLEPMDAGRADPGSMPQAEVIEQAGQRTLQLTWRPRAEAAEWGARITPQRTDSLLGLWSDVPAAFITDLGDGRFRAQLPVVPGVDQGFLRLSISK